MQRGFTLLELMVVLVIGAIMYTLVLGVPFRGPSTADLKAAARTLASGLRQAQSTAMATRRDATLTLDLDAREFQVSGTEGTRALPSQLELKLYTAQDRGRERAQGLDPFLSRRQLRPGGASPWPRASASSWSTSTGSRGGFRSVTSSAKRQVGFTLIEVVVAFLLLSLVMASGFELFTMACAAPPISRTARRPWSSRSRAWPQPGSRPR
jgi:general secretion pathway protein H